MLDSGYILPLAVGVVVAVVVVVMFPIIASAILGIIGFSTLGPVAGSLAAAIQAIIGNVAAGSLFALLQSIAMGGYAVIHVLVTLAIAAIAGILSAAVVLFGPDIWSKLKDIASAIGAHIGAIADKAEEALASFGPGLISMGKAAAAAIIEAIRSIVNMTGKDL